MKTMKLENPKPPMSVNPIKTGSRNSVLVPAQSDLRFTFTRASGAKVSGNTKPTINRLRPAAMHSTQKIMRQSPKAIIPLPKNGASMGETEITSMTIAIRRVAADPVCISRITALGTTIRTAPPKPCKMRAAIKWLMSPYSESYYNSLACRPIVSRITIHWHVAL